MLGGLHEAFGLEQVFFAKRMHIHGSAAFGKGPGCACMVQVNMGQEDMPDIVQTISEGGPLWLPGGGKVE